MKKIEKAIQAALLSWLKENYPTILVTATLNEASYKEVRQIGSTGISDLILFAVKNDIMYILFLELKKKKGKLKPSQILWNVDFDARFKCSNNMRDVAYGFAEAKYIIEKWIANISSHNKHS